jgi:uncharacterized protein (TIGR00369 family)
MADEPKSVFDIMPEQALAMFQARFSDTIPQNKALGVQVVAVRKGVATMKLEWQPHLVGNPETGVLFGGALTTLIDACSGMAVGTMLTEPLPFATLDLRIDYIKPATPRQAVIAEATCFKLTNNVAFTRAVAHHGDPDDPIASSAGTFMMGTKGTVLQAQTIGARLAKGTS